MLSLLRRYSPLRPKAVPLLCVLCLVLTRGRAKHLWPKKPSPILRPATAQPRQGLSVSRNESVANQSKSLCPTGAAELRCKFRCCARDMTMFLALVERLQPSLPRRLRDNPADSGLPVTHKRERVKRVLTSPTWAHASEDKRQSRGLKLGTFRGVSVSGRQTEEFIRNCHARPPKKEKTRTNYYM